LAIFAFDVEGGARTGTKEEEGLGHRPGILVRGLSG
jgi:hypothetical protein